MGAVHVMELLFDIQEQRARQYKDWQAGFIAFLKSKDAWKYQQLIQCSTTTFKDLSAQVNEIREQYKDDKPEIFQLIDNLQQLEKQKLQLTITIQAMRKEQILDKEDVHEAEPEYVAKYKAISKQEQEVTQEINDIIRELRYECYEPTSD